MSSPLFYKELREIWWMGLIALVVVAFIVFDAMGVELGHDWRIQWFRKRGQSPFIGQHDFAANVGFTVLCLGGALGLWQTLVESVGGTWSYLLQRPIARRRVVATKLVAGMTLLVVSIGLPLLGYFLWALSGAHGAPFELWMTEDTLRFWATGTVGYLAAFLIGIRTARVYVSRLWPLVPVWLIFAAQFEYELSPTIGWWLVFVGAIFSLPSIFFAALDRDYA
jgi:hypothetical protein